MRVVMVMYDTLCRRYLSSYGCNDIKTPNFDRLKEKSVMFNNSYVGSMPCMPARREIHTGRYNFLHRSWGPIEPFDDSMPEILKRNDVYAHLVSDHQHYWEDGGATYHNRYNTWQANRGQEGDCWIGQVKDPEELPPDAGAFGMRKFFKSIGYPDMKKNDIVNRKEMKCEEDMPQAKTFAQGLEFIERNHNEDNWFLQIETFDPHEPFFASQRFKEMYPDPDNYDGKQFDWPSYKKVDEPPQEIENCIRHYKALVSMCDYYLGTVLDAFDKYNMWEDTMLIVNTDHGFLLGEHNWLGKCSMPHFNEVANTPLFIYDPRCKKQNETREALVQTIDLAPTILAFFNQNIPTDMEGADLKETIENDKKVREFGLYGNHGEHINITDGRYVYMRKPDRSVARYDYTLMPTHMRGLFSVQELSKAELAGPFKFTKGLKVLKVPAFNYRPVDEKEFGNMLFDLTSDPLQLNPITNLEVELKMINAMRELMLKNDAPDEAFASVSISKDKEFTMEELVKEHKK